MLVGGRALLVEVPSDLRVVAGERRGRPGWLEGRSVRGLPAAGVSRCAQPQASGPCHWRPGCHGAAQRGGVISNCPGDPVGSPALSVGTWAQWASGRGQLGRGGGVGSALPAKGSAACVPRTIAPASTTAKAPVAWATAAHTCPHPLQQLQLPLRHRRAHGRGLLDPCVHGAAVGKVAEAQRRRHGRAALASAPRSAFVRLRALGSLGGLIRAPHHRHANRAQTCASLNS
jgi:hypothetical protein